MFVRAAFIATASLSLSACGIAMQIDHQQKIRESRASMTAALENCARQFPEPNSQFVAKAQCDAAAVRIMRPLLPYPELQDQELATRIVVAERLQNKQITKAEADMQIANMTAQIAGQIRDRSLANRAVLAQESAAASASEAASALNKPREPVTCIRNAGWINCN